MNRIAIKYAFILLIITIIWTLIEHVLGYNTTKHEIGQYTRLIIAFVYYAFVALVIVRVRKQKRGSLTFAEGLKAGTITALTYSFLVTGWYALYAEVINKQFQPTLLAFERHRLEAAHATPEQIADKLKDVESKLESQIKQMEDINNNLRTKSNRAIAAAITAYSRVRIHQFKDICGDVLYSDT